MLNQESGMIDEKWIAEIDEAIKQAESTEKSTEHLFQEMGISRTQLGEAIDRARSEMSADELKAVEEENRKIDEEVQAEADRMEAQNRFNKPAKRSARRGSRMSV